MKRLIIVLGICVVSCNYFEAKKRTSQEIVNQELKTIDWNDVDQYPSFASCDSISGKSQRKHCFETTMVHHINNYLAGQHIVVSQDITDTILMKLNIDKSGSISIEGLTIAPETKQAITNIESLLVGSIATLPEIYPAIKRGQQVQTEFVLPVQIQIE